MGLSDLNNKISGKLCILGYELTIDEDQLEDGGIRGSETLDDLFECGVSYSTALLSAIPSFYLNQIEFPVLVDHILGALYKHTDQWKKLKRALATDEGHVTLYVCPLSGVPVIIPSDKIYKITVSGLALHIKGLGLSALSKLTHQEIDPNMKSEFFDVIEKSGFMAPMIDDMNEFVNAVFGYIACMGDDVYIDFMQELVHSGEVNVDINLEDGSVFVDTDIIDDDFEENFHDEDDHEGTNFLERFKDEDDDVFDKYNHYSNDENVLDLEGEFSVTRDDLKNPNSLLVKGNKTIN